MPFTFQQSNSPSGTQFVPHQYSYLSENTYYEGLSLQANYQFGSQSGTQSAGLGYGSSNGSWNDSTYCEKNKSCGNPVSFSGFASLLSADTSTASVQSTTTSTACLVPHNGGLGWQSLSTFPTTGGFEGGSLMQFTTTLPLQTVIAAINGSLSQLSPYTASYTSGLQAWFISATSSRSSMTLRVYYDYSSSRCVVGADITQGYRCDALWYVFNNVQRACGYS